jgi:hypothetical protein
MFHRGGLGLLSCELGKVVSVIPHFGKERRWHIRAILCPTSGRAVDPARAKNVRQEGSKTTPFAVAAALCGLASPGLTQVTFEQVEAALAALEVANPGAPEPAIEDSSVPTGSEPSEAAASAVVEQLAIPPAPMPGPADTPADQTSTFGSIEFLPILTNEDCPAFIAEIGEEAAVFYDLAADIEAEAESLRARFDVLEEQNRAYEIDDAILSCPSDFVDDVRELLDDFGSLELSTLVQEAETFSVCVQAGRQSVDNRMTELAESSDPNAAGDRLALGGVLERWATADVQVSEAVSTFVFYDQRRRRLESATGAILRRCEFLGSY